MWEAGRNWGKEEKHRNTKGGRSFFMWKTWRGVTMLWGKVGGVGVYQLSVGMVFTIASRSILTPVSIINNTRFRCKNCMISWFFFLGGVIYARLGNARAWDFLEEDVFPKIPHPLCSNFYASSSLSLSLVSNCMNHEYIINCISCIGCITCSYYLR